MEQQELTAKLIEMIESAWKSSNVTADSKIQEDLHAKSLDIFKLGMLIEKAFGTKVPVKQLMGAGTVGDMASVIAGCL